MNALQSILAMTAGNVTCTFTTLYISGYCTQLPEKVLPTIVIFVEYVEWKFAPMRPSPLPAVIIEV